MIGRDLSGHVALLATYADTRPQSVGYALEAIIGDAEQLQDLCGDGAVALRAAGTRVRGWACIACTAHAAGNPAGLVKAVAHLMTEAVEVIRLEAERAPFTGAIPTFNQAAGSIAALSRFGAPARPAQPWQPRLIQGGRA